MAQTKGIRSTESILQDTRPLHWDEKIYRLNPDATPFTRLSSKMGKMETTDPEFNWFEKDLQAEWFTNTAAVLIAATTIPVANVEYFAVGDLIKVPFSGELIRVDAVAAGTGAGNLTVVRSVGAIAAVAIPDATTLLLMANASAEFAGIPTIKSVDPIKVTNFTQITKTPFGVSGTLDATNLRIGSQMAEDRAVNAIEHAKKIEKMAFFGDKGEDTSSGQPRRYTNGLLGMIGSGQTVATGTGTMTEAQWEDYLEILFDKGSKKKVVFLPSAHIKLINGFVKGKLQTFQKDKTYGVSIMEYICPFGTVGLINHNEVLTGGYQNTAVGLDMDKIKYRPLKGRDTRLYKNVQTPDVDGQIDMYMSEIGFQAANPECHAILDTNA